MLATVLACATSLGALDLPVTLSQHGLPAAALQALREELEARLPGSGRGEGVGYAVEIVVEPTATVVYVVDPAGANVSTDSLPPDDDPLRLARSLAVLVEGRIRLHRERLGALLALLTPREPLAPPPTIVAPTAPLAKGGRGRLVAAGVLAMDGRGERIAPALRLTAELDLDPLVRPDVAVQAAWPRSLSYETRPVALTEGTLALGMSLPLLDFGWQARAGGAALLCLVSARAESLGGDPQTVLGVYAGARARLAAHKELGERLGLDAELAVDVVPSYPRLTWRGETVAASGPWRASLAIGAHWAF